MLHISDEPTIHIIYSPMNYKVLVTRLRWLTNVFFTSRFVGLNGLSRVLLFYRESLILQPYMHLVLFFETLKFYLIQSQKF